MIAAGMLELSNLGPGRGPVFFAGSGVYECRSVGVQECRSVGRGRGSGTRSTRSAWKPNLLVAAGMRLSISLIIS
jgi:hypothetical protein